ncbi:MAG: class I SAM-dependent methyltransferase [Brevefilum sp.]
MKNITSVPRSKEQAQNYYDRISGIYDWLTASEKPLIKKGVNLLSPKPDERILEIGCGTGPGLKFIEENSKGSARVAGLDLSRNMLLKSREKTSAGLIQADAAKLPISHSRFDGVFCSFTLELFSENEIPSVLREIHRILRSDGRLVAVALSKYPENLAVTLYEFAHQLFPVALDCRPIPLKQILEDNDFRVITEEKLMNWGLPVEMVECKPVNSQ